MWGVPGCCCSVMIAARHNIESGMGGLRNVNTTCRTETRSYNTITKTEHAYQHLLQCAARLTCRAAPAGQQVNILSDITVQNEIHTSSMVNNL